MDTKIIQGINPLTGMDFPDPDVIRVGDTYYMISTTMHFFPGACILRSFDLVRWEICTYLYETLEHTSGEILEGEENIYGHGMWAASLRCHQGMFYVVFIAHEWDRTFLFTSDRIEGPWEKHYIKGIYHDPSLLFDDDGKIYIAHGNRNIFLTELKEDMSGPQPGGLNRVIVRDAPGDFLGYEGSHLYKINGKYVLTLIHSRQDRWFRTQACFIADYPEEVWAGGDVLESDLDGLGSGVAQGGLVDTPEGKWFAILFQDRGAVGRIPVLVPVTWNRFGYPVYGKVTKEVSVISSRPDYRYLPLAESDCFDSPGAGNPPDIRKLKKVWQFNHEPREGCWGVGEGCYWIRTDRLSPTLEFARNTLTQRTVIPRCAAEVTVDTRQMNPGDVAGLCVLTGTYGLIGISREEGCCVLTRIIREKGHGEETETDRVLIENREITLRAEVNFGKPGDTAGFFFRDRGIWKPLGGPHNLRFTLDHFCGCRFGLFLYSRQRIGGKASFRNFQYIL